MFYHFATKHACVGQTDRQTNGRTDRQTELRSPDRASTAASHGKK